MSATVQYRYLKTDGLWDDIHLKNMIVDILRRTPDGASNSRAARVRHRKIDLDQDGTYVILNKMSDPSDWNGPVFCGQLLSIRAGAEIPGITQSPEDDISELELRQLYMGEENSVVDGILYFALVHNHVGLIEGQKTRARTLERYLTRLLQDADEFEPGQTVILNAQLEGVHVGRVEEMSIAPKRVQKSSTSEVDQTVAAGEAEGEGQTVFDVLRTLGWQAQEIEQLRDSLPDEGWIEGVFKMVFKRKGRKAAIDRSVLEEALRNLDPASVGLLDPSGGSERKGIYKLSSKQPIERQNGMLDPSHAMQSIVEMLKKWAASGKIDCDFER